MIRALVLATALLGCGYHSVHAGDGREHLAVVLAESKVPDAVASDEVLAGAREELARGGSLSSGSGYPRCEIEILRADEASDGIAASSAPGGLVPSSRATRIGLVARAWIVREPGAERERDTGDLRTVATVAVAGEARTATFRQSDALRAAGRRLGQRLASRIRGIPSPSDE